jgi:hypothetical protein
MVQYLTHGLAACKGRPSAAALPNSLWLVKVRAGRHWTRKSRVSADFRKILRYFRTFMDVTGRLWSWDGWPPHSVSNRLFVRRKYILIPFEGPKQGQKRHGFLRTSLDVPFIAE